MRRFRLRFALTTSALVVGIGAAAPVAATASDTAYWGNNNVGTVSFAKLDGTGGGGQLNTTGATATNPAGIAIDAAAGRIYWASAFNSTINFANLDGTGGGGQISTAGTTANNIRGLAIDPAAGRAYWANSGDHSLSFADLNGTGGAQLNTAGATTSSPHGVAIDPAAGRLFWANTGNGTISFANLDGSGGGGQLDTSGAPVSFPQGLAIDSTAGRIYWANRGDSISGISPSIGFASLDGSGGGQLSTAGATLSRPQGVAIDPAGGRIYWADNGNNRISFARLDGTGGGGQLNTSGATTSAPTFLALLRAPSGAGAPGVTGGTTVGSTLDCSPGAWAPDLLGAFLSREPQGFEYQWTLGGSDIDGATASTYGPNAPGDYACRVTAANRAGATSQTSDTVAVTLATPSLAATATGTVTLGDAISDAATLGEGTSPTGTITFRAYGPSDATCSQAAVFTDTETVSGNGAYATNPSFSPAAAGTYRWIASYDGDASNAAVAATCGSSGQTSVVTEPSSAGPQRRTCKSLRRKLRFSRQRLEAAVHEFSRERLSQRITRLRQMIKTRRCT